MKSRDTQYNAAHNGNLLSATGDGAHGRKLVISRFYSAKLRYWRGNALNDQ